jgi:P4 family phage/plasmid primase-like protien
MSEYTVLNEIEWGFPLGFDYIPLAGGTKKPIHDDWSAIEPFSIETLRDFARIYNIGARMGRNGYFDIDLDCAEARGIAHKILPATRTFGRKSARRSHFVYRDRSGQIEAKVINFNEAITKKHLFELRGNGHQTMFPGSTHPSGERVEWDNNRDIAEVSIDLIEDRLGVLYAAVVLARNYPTGGNRQRFLFHIAGWLIKGGCDEDDAKLIIESAAEFNGDDEIEKRVQLVDDAIDQVSRGNLTGLTSLKNEMLGSDTLIEQLKAVGDVLQLRYSESKAVEDCDDVDLMCTDVANGERFVKRHENKIRYVVGAGCYGWSGKHWERDEAGTKPMELARETADSIFEEAKEMQDNKSAKKLFFHARKTQNHTQLVRLIEQARTHREMVSLMEDFDSDRMLFNCANGTIDLRNGILAPHSRQQMLSKVSPISYDPNAKAPRWEQFLREVFQGDEELIGYVQRAVGYSITGETKEQIFFVLHGDGANGKTTFINVILHVMDAYGMEADPKIVLLNKHDGIARSGQARLPGVRLVALSEIKQGGRLDEQLVKQITGSNKMNARLLFKEEFTFEPVCKLWLAVNHRPKLTGDDYAMQRRLKDIPFKRKFEEWERDKNLENTLRAEAPGILAWLVQGAVEWNKVGIGTCKAVEDATQEYLTENDPLALFIEECCATGVNHLAKRSSFVSEFTRWCESNRYPKPSRKVTKQIESKGYRIVDKWIEGSSHKCIEGIGLLVDSSLLASVA